MGDMNLYSANTFDGIKTYSGYDIKNHFADVGKMVKIGSGAEREQEKKKLDS